ncbi:MAG TPA: DNA polymerase, partial [Dehalococcoidia bacterium]|nr:DNA polymerase [Dehalococcoidia bacterium]
QGSSADMIKEAMIRYERIKQHGFLLITVHDELIVLVPEKYAVSEMKLLKQAMDSVELDAPLVSDGEMGYRWGELESCE